jgi:hypothetical protein
MFHVEQIRSMFHVEHFWVQASGSRIATTLFFPDDSGHAPNHCRPEIGLRRNRAASRSET